MSWRIESSSSARLSMSASVRCVNSGTSVIAMDQPPLKYLRYRNLRRRRLLPSKRLGVEHTIARCRGDAGLHPTARLVLDTGAQIAHMALSAAPPRTTGRYPCGSRTASARPRPRRRPSATSPRPRSPSCPRGRTRPFRRCRAPRRRDTANLSRCSRSAIPAAAHVRCAASSIGLGSTGPGLALPPVGHRLVEAGQIQPALGTGGAQLQPVALVAGRQLGQLLGEQHVGLRRRRVHVHDIAELRPADQCPQHRHHRRDTRARREEQHRGRRRVGHDEIALGRSQSHDRAGLDPADQVSRQEPLGHRLDGDGDGARTLLGTRCCSGTLVSEYDRHRQRPSTSRPMPTYWPA